MPSRDGHLLALSLGALGVVFGDIGTSPLYVLRVCFAERGGLALNQECVLGVISLIVYSLVAVICVKYLLFILRADNRGEGGILALMALPDPPMPTDPSSSACSRFSACSARPSSTATG